MNVGLVYDLHSEYLAASCGEEAAADFDNTDCIEALNLGLQAMGFQVEAVGSAKSLAAALAKGHRWDLVFNTAQGLFGSGSEALAPALLDAWHIPYTFSEPLVMALCRNKEFCKRVARDLGLPTADFALVRTEKDIAHVRLPYPVFAKPLRATMRKGLDKGAAACGAARADNRKELTSICRTLLKRFKQPILVEEHLSGREFTVGIAGTGELARPLGVMEVALSRGAESGAFPYSNKANLESMAEYLPVEGPEAEEAARLALDAWKGLGCRDGGQVDIRLDAEGRACLLAVEPLPGLNPKLSDLPILCSMNGVSFQDLLRMLVQSALERLPLDPDKERRARG